MNYMVMECHPGYAVVLSADGRFLKVANMRYEVGQTVTNVVEMCLPQVQEQPVKNHSRRWISMLSAVAACLVLVVTSIFFTGQMPYASVYLTINPAVRIDVNRSDVVVGVEGVNADGQNLLNGYDHRKKDLDTVMDELVDLAIDMGYLHEGGKITLSLDANEEWIINHKEHLNIHLNNHLADKISVTIDVTPQSSGQQSVSQPIQVTSTGQTVVIPIGPESDYGNSAYGNEPAGGDSEYTDSGYRDSVYHDTRSDDNIYGDDGQSDYDTPEADDGQSDYEAPDADDGDSIYEEPNADDGQSDYAAQSGYDDGGQSDYEVSEDGDSEYNE